MSTFKLIRVNDQSGVSGTGEVLEGWVDHAGRVVVSWYSDINMRSKSRCSSLGIYESLDDFKKIHIDPHPNNFSEILWD